MNLFHPDSVFSKWMTKLFDACLLNLLWLVCSLPMFTIGPATQAMYYVALKHAEGEDGSITCRYFQEFRRCFGQSIAIGLIMLGSGGLLLLDIYLAHMAGDGPIRSLLPVFLILLLAWACVLVYVFAVQAKFDNPVAATLQISTALALKHLPQTLLMLVTSLVLTSLIYFAPVLLIVNIGLIPMVNAGLLLKTFAPYLPKTVVKKDSDFPKFDKRVATDN